MRLGLSSFFCIWMFNCFSMVCLKGNISSIELMLHLCQNHLCIVVWVYFWILYPLPLIYVPTSLPIPHCLYYHSYIVNFTIGSSDPSHFIIVFKMILAGLGSVPFHINCRISLSMCIKNLAGISVGFRLHLQINLGRIDISTMLSFLIHRHSLSLHLFMSLIS